MTQARSPNYGLSAGAPSNADMAVLQSLEGHVRGHRKNPAIPGVSDTWAVARAFLADGDIDYAISWADIALDEVWAGRMLDEIGLARGDLMFLSYLYAQSGQTWPWLKAAFDRGVKLATGMPTLWDAYRLEMYLRLLDVRVVFGLSPGVLDGLEGAGHDIVQIFAKPRHVIALPGAWERLHMAGLNPWKLHWLGPILAVDPCDGSGARFDHPQWAIEAADDRLLISNKQARMSRFDRADTGLKGAVETINGEPRLIIHA